MIISIAWRNIWRNRLRSLVVISAVVLGLTGCIFSVAWMNGMMQQMITSSIESQISNIQVHHPGYEANDELRYFIANADSVIEVIKSNRQVKAVSRRTRASVMASTATTGTGVVIEGIIPADEKTVTDIFTKLVKGDYFESETRSNPILVGEKLAHKLNADIGNKIIITAQTLNDTITYGAFRVVGIYKTQNSMFDETTVFVKNNHLCELLGFEPENTSEIAIKLYNNLNTKTVAASLGQELHGLTVKTWMQIRPEFEFFNSWTQQMLYIFLLVILLALAFGIVNTMLMAVMERVREIGMLMAVGMNKGKIFRMIMLETVFLSFTGGIIGIVISYGLVGFFGKVGIDMSLWGEGLSEVGYASIAYPSVNNSYYAIVAVMVVVTAIFASVYPAKKALKLKPASAIRDDG